MANEEIGEPLSMSRMQKPSHRREKHPCRIISSYIHHIAENYVCGTATPTGPGTRQQQYMIISDEQHISHSPRLPQPTEKSQSQKPGPTDRDGESVSVLVVREIGQQAKLKSPNSEIKPCRRLYLPRHKVTISTHGIREDLAEW
jgi:hypothetical protein